MYAAISSQAAVDISYVLRFFDRTDHKITVSDPRYAKKIMNAFPCPVYRKKVFALI